MELVNIVRTEILGRLWEETNLPSWFNVDTYIRKLENNINAAETILNEINSTINNNDFSSESKLNLIKEIILRWELG